MECARSQAGRRRGPLRRIDAGPVRWDRLAAEHGHYDRAHWTATSASSPAPARARAKAAGATIVREPADEDYGSREYSARDPEGDLWSFGTYDPYASG